MQRIAGFYQIQAHFDNFTLEHGGVNVIKVCLAVIDLLVRFAVVLFFFFQKTMEVNRVLFAVCWTGAHAGLTLFVSECKSVLL